MKVEKINEDLYFIILNNEKIGSVEKKFGRVYLTFFDVFVSSYESIEISPIEIKTLILKVLNSFLKYPALEINGDRYSIKFENKEIFYISSYNRSLNINIKIPGPLRETVSKEMEKKYLLKVLSKEVFLNLSYDITKMLIDYVSEDSETIKYSIKLIEV